MEGKKDEGILLESGTNEIEVVAFSVGTAVYGINVIKVREVVNYIEPSAIPEAHPCVEGVIELRNEVLPLVDLACYLDHPPSDNPEKDRIVVSEFNQAKVAFHVHEVFRIHRISWTQIEKTPPLTQSDQACTTGVIKMEDRMILLLDFEKIMYDIDRSVLVPEAAAEMEPELVDQRAEAMVWVAEDSATLNEILASYLPSVGYSSLRFFADGSQVWQQLEGAGAPVIGKDLHLLITDIEMPQMDGHTLTRRIKEHPQLQQLPVVIFSSLITAELRHKGESIGADAQVSKPDFHKLAGILDSFIMA